MHIINYVRWKICSRKLFVLYFDKALDVSVSSAIYACILIRTNRSLLWLRAWFYKENHYFWYINFLKPFICFWKISKGLTSKVDSSKHLNGETKKKVFNNLTWQEKESRFLWKGHIFLNKSFRSLVIFILKALHIQHLAWSDFLIFITRVDIADIINASESNRDCSEPVASTNLDNEVMQQDFVFEDEENNQVRNVNTIKNLCVCCARCIILIASCVPLILEAIVHYLCWHTYLSWL